MNKWKSISERLIIILAVACILLTIVSYFAIPNNLISNIAINIFCSLTTFLISFYFFRKINEAKVDDLHNSLLQKFSNNIVDQLSLLLPETDSKIRSQIKSLKEIGITGAMVDFDFNILIDKISTAEREIIILENWICKDIKGFDRAFENVSKKNITPEVILLDPHSPFAIQRCKDLGDKKGTVTNNIQNTILHIQRLQNEKNISIDLKLHNSLPSLQIFICDNWCVIGFYLMGSLSHDMPQICIDMKDSNEKLTVLGDAITNHLAKLRIKTKEPHDNGFVEELHHVNLPVRDLATSLAFYIGTLRLQEIPRPDFGFPGAWLGLPGGQHIHLVENSSGTFRPLSKEKENIQPKDVHFALRVDESNFQYILHEISKDQDPLFKPFIGHVEITQMYIQDPDSHIIEITMLTEEQQKLYSLKPNQI